ncbi:MAG: hypothetical protein ABSA21_10745 [Candidatus Limnocylindrales bacterium]|jgi:hypothetical protein
MSDKKRVAEDNAGMFLADRGVIVVPINSLNVGPGKPGPGDEWKVPTEGDEIEDDVTVEPVHSDGTAVLPLHPANKGWPFPSGGTGPQREPTCRRNACLGVRLAGGDEALPLRQVVFGRLRTPPVRVARERIWRAYTVRVRPAVRRPDWPARRRTRRARRASSPARQ